MKFLSRNKRYTTPFLIITLLVTLLGIASACEDFGQFPPPSQPAQQPQPQPAPETTAITITTKDAALLAVYQHLLSQAESQEAKLYLADFYGVSDNWSAVSEFFKDGSGTWYVQVDMTASETWEWQPHWQQASWFVFRDGRVIPSNRLNANALRIEADLQELSLPSEEPAE